LVAAACEAADAQQLREVMSQLIGGGWAGRDAAELLAAGQAVLPKRLANACAGSTAGCAGPLAIWSRATPGAASLLVGEQS
jgi:hypothetical protein